MATSKQKDKEHAKGNIAMKTPPIVSQQEWEAARQQLLVKEKAFTRSRDALAAERRRMPWMAVEKKYEFDGPKSRVSLLDLFEGRRQLIVYRAFFEPGVFGWPEHACRGCSLGADQVSHLAHLNARDTTLAWASRAPQADIARLKARMGWEMPWYTITDSFDADFGVDEWHGHNVFFRDGERVFRTYFIHGRGDAAMGTIWSYLDITPLGRQETWEDSPEGYPQTPMNSVNVSQYLEDTGAVEARYLAFLETSSALRPALHRYCARMTGSVMDGEDVVQATLFEAYRKLDKFDESRPLKPWLFRIAHNRCIDFLRRRGVRDEAEAAVAVPDATSPAEPPLGTGKAVELLVLTLPPKERACVP